MEWFSSASGQLFLLFGSWSALTGGIWKLFERVEKGSSQYFKQSMAAWLTGLDAGIALRSMGDLLAHSFDAVFGTKHFTWRCFGRSCIASFIYTGALLLLWVALRPAEGGSFQGDAWLLIVFSVFVLVINVVPDYMALLKTRYILRSISNRQLLMLWLLLDVFLSIAISSIALIVGLVVIDFVDSKLSGFPAPMLSVNELIGASLRILPEAVTMHYDDKAPFPIGPFFYSTLMTSVWVWLYASSSVLIKGSGQLSLSLKSVLRLVDVDKQPFVSIGIVSILLVTIGYVIAVPFIVLF